MFSDTLPSSTIAHAKNLGTPHADSMLVYAFRTLLEHAIKGGANKTDMDRKLRAVALDEKIGKSERVFPSRRFRRRLHLHLCDVSTQVVRAILVYPPDERKALMAVHFAITQGIANK